MTTRRAPLFLATALLLLLPTAPAQARWILTCEAAIPATMVDSVNSADAYAGQRFRFKITSPSRIDGVPVPAGTLGYGFVRGVTAASNRDRNGSLALEPRVVVGPKGLLQVMADPRETDLWAPATSLAERAGGYLPIPGILRTAVNEVRNGKNVTIGPGFNFHIMSVADPRHSQPCRKVGS